MNSEKLSEKIRLTPLEIEHIIKSFKKNFSAGDELWVFGSRADRQAKGGDIDLYIETSLEDSDALWKRKSAFWIDLQERLGEQKIDIVIHKRNDESELLIYKMAKKYGVKIVTQEEQIDFLKNQIEITNIHSLRIMESLDHLSTVLPLSGSALQALPFSDLSSIEMLISRFSKLQDDIGQKIFPKILILMGKNSQGMSLIDILHQLEKMGFLSDRAFWEQMRDVRNKLTHEYPDKPEEMAEAINECAKNAKVLVEYWETLKEAIQKKIFSSPE